MSINFIEYKGIKFFNIQDVCFSDLSGKVISCNLSINDEMAPIVPFNAVADDVEVYGASFYSDLKSGKFGAVAPFNLSIIEIKAQAVQEKELRLSDATSTISPLQDAVDLDIATDEEKVKLDEWKKYRVLLNRIDTSLAPNITWPSKPAE
ncbi:tail fiber assembly protein [Salmonella enterica subsp. enterica serovar Choleraesuis]|nr:tail fiber assembly protein [Salmonella enterica subsp. enterica serovar Choleraesuis]